MKAKTAQKILTKIENDYNEIADDFSYTRVYPWPEFDNFKKYIKDDQNLIDIGCGNGRLNESLKEKKIYYNGVDLSPQLIRKAQQKYLGQFFKVGNILKMPFKKNEFDIALGVAVLHHVPSQVLRKIALEEVSRILKPGSYFLMTNWNLHQIKYRWLIYKYQTHSLFGLKDLDKGDALIPWRNPEGTLLQKRYYHSFTLKELEKLAKLTNFKIIEQYYSLRGEKSNMLKAFNIVSVWQKQ